MVAALDARFRVAVTVLTPAFSPMLAGLSTRVAAGVASSSVMVSVAPVTAWLALLVPVTASDLFGASTALSTAVTVTAPVLVVALAAKVSVVFALRVKSLVVAGAVGVTVTVTVDWLDEAADRVPVTVVEPPFSPMLVEPSDSVTLGVPSSSVMVRVAPFTV